MPKKVLKIGETFRTFKTFRNALARYQTQKHLIYKHTKGEKMTEKDKIKLKYKKVRYICKGSTEQNTSTIDACPAFIKLKHNPDKKCLVIKDMSDKHNHPLTKGPPATPKGQRKKKSLLTEKRIKELEMMLNTQPNSPPGQMSSTTTNDEAPLPTSMDSSSKKSPKKKSKDQPTDIEVDFGAEARSTEEPLPASSHTPSKNSPNKRTKDQPSTESDPIDEVISIEDEDELPTASNRSSHSPSKKIPETRVEFQPVTEEANSADETMSIENPFQAPPTDRSCHSPSPSKKIPKKRVEFQPITEEANSTDEAVSIEYPIGAPPTHRPSHSPSKKIPKKRVEFQPITEEANSIDETLTIDLNEAPPIHRPSHSPSKKSHKKKSETQISRQGNTVDQTLNIAESASKSRSSSPRKKTKAKQQQSGVVSKRSNYLSWEDYFMAVALLSSQRSKDPSTQVGACIVSPEKKIVGVGYNGMPNGCSDDQLPWGKEGELEATKYAYVCHAEMNAILNKNSHDVKGCTIYVAMFPCNECAKLIIQSGIVEVVYLSDKHHDKPPTAASRKLLSLANICTRQFVPAHSKLEIDFTQV